MFIVAHIAIGLILTELTGSFWALFAAIVVDIDHLFVYVKHKVTLKQFWKLVTDPEDPLGDQRNILHSLFVVLSCLWIFLFSLEQRLALQSQQGT